MWSTWKLNKNKLEKNRQMISSDWYVTSKWICWRFRTIICPFFYSRYVASVSFITEDGKIKRYPPLEHLCRTLLPFDYKVMVCWNCRSFIGGMMEKQKQKTKKNKCNIILKLVMKVYLSRKTLKKYNQLSKCVKKVLLLS